MAYTLQHNSRFSFFSSRKCCSYYTMSTILCILVSCARSDPRIIIQQPWDSLRFASCLVKMLLQVAQFSAHPRQARRTRWHGRQVCVFCVAFFPPPPLARDRIARPRQRFSPELCRKAIAATHYEAIITLRMADALREAAAAGISTSEAKAERMPKIICYCITHSMLCTCTNLLCA